MEKEDIHNEQELLRLVAQGDMLAYQQLFDLYWDQVYGIGLRLTKTPEHAKDLAQDIFLKLWDSRTKLTEVRDFRSYLFVITRNLIHDQIRTKIFHESNREFLTNYFAYNGSSPQELLEQKELGEALNAAIRKLPPRLQQVFNLRRLEGLSHVEIAQRLNITTISSKTYMVRALMALRKEIMKDPGKLFLVATFLFNFL
ncbi:MAG TPA: RNA polymerase sigma factor [Puia sp.]|nr:RNA polymerase sigma factor [Puia sp.]